MPELNKKLEGTFAALEDLTSAPSTNAAIRALTATVTTLNPQLRFYGPFVTVCNAPNYFFTYLAEHFSEPDQIGESQRALLNIAGRQDDSLGAMGADEPANGHEVNEGNKQYLHGNPYGAAITPDGRADCEAGQRGYLERNATLLRQEVQDRAGRADARRAGPDLHRAAPACPRARPTPRSPRPASTRRSPRPRAVSDETRRRGGMSTLTVGIVALVVTCVGVYLGFTKSIPFRAALRGQGRVQERQQPAHRVAGADRRRRGRQGHEDRAREARATTARS